MPALFAIRGDVDDPFCRCIVVVLSVVTRYLSRVFDVTVKEVSLFDWLIKVVLAKDPIDIFGRFSGGETVVCVSLHNQDNHCASTF